MLFMFCNDSIYLQNIYLQMGLVAVILTKIKRCALQIYEEVDFFTYTQSWQ